MEDTVLITKYISTWNWMLISFMFFIGAFILYSLPRNTLTLVFSIAFLLVFIGTQFVSSQRRKELEQHNE
jgi:hypothetical protein